MATRNVNSPQSASSKEKHFLTNEPPEGGPSRQAYTGFDDGEALFEAICAHGLEGVVAKRRSSRYQPGERGWVKIKNRNYCRYEMEREGRGRVTFTPTASVCLERASSATCDAEDFRTSDRRQGRRRPPRRSGRCHARARRGAVAPAVGTH
jgi:hypothetical protein